MSIPSYAIDCPRCPIYSSTQIIPRVRTSNPVRDLFHARYGCPSAIDRGYVMKLKLATSQGATSPRTVRALFMKRNGQTPTFSKGTVSSFQQETPKQLIKHNRRSRNPLFASAPSALCRSGLSRTLLVSSSRTLTHGKMNTIPTERLPDPATYAPPPTGKQQAPTERASRWRSGKQTFLRSPAGSTRCRRDGLSGEAARSWVYVSS